MRSVDYRTSSTSFKPNEILTLSTVQQQQQHRLQHLSSENPSRSASRMGSNSLTADGALVGQSTTNVYRSGTYSNHNTGLWDGATQYGDARDPMTEPANYRVSPSWKIAHDVRPKVTTTLWEEEGTLCFQVEAKGICVARREDNNMINGTKLLNVAGMTRGRRDGILKTEKHRHVVKVGAMHLKGVWIPFERAFVFAKKEHMVNILYPLFVEDIKSILYDPLKVNPIDSTGTGQSGHQIISGGSDTRSISAPSVNNDGLGSVGVKCLRTNGTKYYQGAQQGKPGHNSMTNYQQSNSSSSHLPDHVQKHRRSDQSRSQSNPVQDISANNSNSSFMPQYPNLPYEISYFSTGQQNNGYGMNPYDQTAVSAQAYSGFPYAMSDNPAGYHEQTNYDSRNNYMNQYAPAFATPLPTPPPVFNYNRGTMNSNQLDVKPEPLSPIQESSACKKDSASSVNEAYQRHYDTNAQISTATTSSDAYGHPHQSSDVYSTRIKTEHIDTTGLKTDVPPAHVDVPFSAMDGRRYFSDNQSANFYMPYEKRFKTDR